MWVRGLKQHNNNYLEKGRPVAPHVGAWIETDTYGIIIGIYRSHPMWVRGLKPFAN